jgi:hypothetical protein
VKLLVYEALERLSEEEALMGVIQDGMRVRKREEQPR